MDSYSKYLKYKQKYLNLLGGAASVDNISLIDYRKDLLDTLNKIDPKSGFVSASPKIVQRQELGCFTIFKIIMLNGNPIGMITSKWKNKQDMNIEGYDTIFMIQNITIDHKYQRNGYGSIALTKFIELAQAKYNLKEIYISSRSISALKLYGRLGFNFIKGHNLEPCDKFSGENKYEAIMVKLL